MVKRRKSKVTPARAPRRKVRKARPRAQLPKRKAAPRRSKARGTIRARRVALGKKIRTKEAKIKSLRRQLDKARRDADEWYEDHKRERAKAQRPNPFGRGIPTSGRKPSRASHTNPYTGKVQSLQRQIGYAESDIDSYRGERARLR